MVLPSALCLITTTEEGVRALVNVYAPQFPTTGPPYGLMINGPGHVTPHEHAHLPRFRYVLERRLREVRLCVTAVARVAVAVQAQRGGFSLQSPSVAV